MKDSHDDLFSECSWSRRRFLQTAGMSMFSFLVGCGLSKSILSAQKRKPNIILIFTDDHGYSSIGCQGCPDVPTPQIDSIANAGIRFTNGYVTAPLCGPSRAGLLTGRYQQRFGFEENSGPISKANKNFGLPVEEKTLADYLKECGYVTGMVGKWHLGLKPKCQPQRCGFDEFFGFLHGAHSYTKSGINTPNSILRGTMKVDEKEYLTDAFTREAVSFIERHKDVPFFLYLPYNAIHGPDEAPERYKEKFNHIADLKRRVWAGMLAALDEGVGNVLKKVRETNLEEDTIIFLIGDNGGYPVGGISANTPLRGGKSMMYEGGIRVPFLMQWKGHIPAGKIYEKQVSTLDIVPTVLTASGTNTPKICEGVNLFPYLEGKNNGVPHEKLFWRMVEKWGARIGDWKLVVEDDKTYQLYNLAEDIGEKNDLSKKYPEKVKEMVNAYNEWDSMNVDPKWFDSRRKRKTIPAKYLKEKLI